MPAADPEDQQAARTIEASLRAAVQQLERPPVELDWFMSLPKRVRRSGRLIETAQFEARVLLEHMRHTWAKEREVESVREARLAELRAKPRDLECLKSPACSKGAWEGIGRRKKRCRAFNAIGRAFNARKQVRFSEPLVTAPELASSSPVDIMMADPYVTTPPALRESVEKLVMSVRKLPPYSTNQAWETYSPNPDYMPSPIRRDCPTPNYPCDIQPGDFSYCGYEVDPTLVYIAARGQHALRPTIHCSLREIGFDIWQAEEIYPGFLGVIINLLFPDGYEWPVDCSLLDAVVNLCVGWQEIQIRPP